MRFMPISAFVFAAVSAVAHAEVNPIYRVTITNLTAGQSFTPQLVATNTPSFRAFSPGAPASDALAAVAEAGDTSLLTEELMAQATAVMTVPGLLGPGQSVSVRIEGRPLQDALTVAAMLLPTNDTFFALQGMRLPAVGSESYDVPAYDAGSELNDQSCASIPGPLCQGEASSEPADTDEGFVHIAPGFHVLPNPDESGAMVLGPVPYDWRNPVARVTVRRVR